MLAMSYQSSVSPLTGREDQTLVVSCEGSSMTLRAEGASAPIIERTLDSAVSSTEQLETYR